MSRAKSTETGVKFFEVAFLESGAAAAIPASTTAGAIAAPVRSRFHVWGFSIILTPRTVAGPQYNVRLSATFKLQLLTRKSCPGPLGTMRPGRSVAHNFGVRGACSRFAFQSVSIRIHSGKGLVELALFESPFEVCGADER